MSAGNAENSKCDEELIGFRKIGAHRKFDQTRDAKLFPLFIVDLKFKATSAFQLRMNYAIDVIMPFYVADATDLYGKKYAKVFYLSMDFEASWMLARTYCKTYGMDLATFETERELTSFNMMATRSKFYFDRWTHVGGVSKFVDKHREWYWVGTNKKINYQIQFATGQPNNYLGRQNCLGLSKEEREFEFQDIDCHGRFEEKFLCQKICEIE